MMIGTMIDAVTVILDRPTINMDTIIMNRIIRTTAVNVPMPLSIARASHSAAPAL